MPRLTGGGDAFISGVVDVRTETGTAEVREDVGSAGRLAMSMLKLGAALYAGAAVVAGLRIFELAIH